jgi:3-oxoacyl-[acyl-carrier-protein] synthase-1
MAASGAIIRGIGMMSAVGVGTKPTVTSVAAGVARLSESGIRDRRFGNVVMGTLGEDELPPLDPAIETEHKPTARQRRMLRLAGAALQEAAADLAEPKAVPLFLGAPEAVAGRPAPVDGRFLELLAKQGTTAFAVARSKVFANGRAAFFYALEAAVRVLESGGAEHVLVGGVDSYLDLWLLAQLEQEGRVLGETVMDGFVPGEGAGFLLLSAGSTGKVAGPAIARVSAVATASEPGHRYSEEPYLGDGLANAIAAVFERAGARLPPVRCVWAGFNGENLGAKEWGTAFLRSREHFAEEYRMEHPVDCFGDPGAALGALLVGIAASVAAEDPDGDPALAWCSSDLEARGAAIVRRAG